RICLEPYVRLTVDMVRLPEWPVERLAEARILSDLPSPGERFRLSRVGAPGCNLGVNGWA
ncbi:hypothetical protein, partial [Escherichia coli]|uniref:hypothetical protein n=1 Tax=Escherichia coli TaxID=562 RepID=UPI001BDBD831